MAAKRGGKRNRSKSSNLANPFFPFKLRQKIQLGDNAEMTVGLLRGGSSISIKTEFGTINMGKSGTTIRMRMGNGTTIVQRTQTPRKERKSARPGKTKRRTS